MVATNGEYGMEHHNLEDAGYLDHAFLPDIHRSTNNTEVIKLAPIQTDYKRMCGTKLEFQV